MSKNFFVILPNNTKDYPNTLNKFRVRLPKLLQFEGQWVCGLHGIFLRNSWVSIGTTEHQFMDIFLKNNFEIRIPIRVYILPLKI